MKLKESEKVADFRDFERALAYLLKRGILKVKLFGDLLNESDTSFFKRGD